MPRFEPFRGLRYDFARLDPAAVTAPPYDVIDADDRAVLLARHADNVVRVDLPMPGDAPDPYRHAADLLEGWRGEGIVQRDPQPAFYVYRMDFSDELGRARHTAGVIGALELCRPGETPAGGQPILPHENTTPKAKSDRLELLRATAVNLSSVWGLSPAAGLSDLLVRDEAPLAMWVDDDAVSHSLWLVTDADRSAAISAAVASEPIVIADGHHRFETSLTYRDERREVQGTGAPYDYVMTYVVELAEDQLTVLPIHRLVSGLPRDFDLVAALAPFFEIAATDSIPEGSMALVTESGTWALQPRPEAMTGVRDLDSSRLEVALAGLPPHEVVFQHGTDNVTARVAKGDAQAGFLLRPATVEQIVAIAHGGERMPPKTTYFHPKPRTGVVFRDVR